MAGIGRQQPGPVFRCPLIKQPDPDPERQNAGLHSQHAHVLPELGHQPKRVVHHRACQTAGEKPEMLADKPTGGPAAGLRSDRDGHQRRHRHFLPQMRDIKLQRQPDPIRRDKGQHCPALPGQQRRNRWPLIVGIEEVDAQNASPEPAHSARGHVWRQQPQIAPGPSEGCWQGAVIKVRSCAHQGESGSVRRDQRSMCHQHPALRSTRFRPKHTPSAERRNGDGAPRSPGSFEQRKDTRATGCIVVGRLG